MHIMFVAVFHPYQQTVLNTKLDFYLLLVFVYHRLYIITSNNNDNQMLAIDKINNLLFGQSIRHILTVHRPHLNYQARM